jgi:hypothetical protein
LLNPRYALLTLKPFPPDEALKAVYTYGKLFQTDLTEESALAIRALARNHPYYISCLIRSNLADKDLSTPEGVEAVLNYEVLHKRGRINTHWMEYIQEAFRRTNGKTAQALVLYLSKERHVEKTRPEILSYLKKVGIEIDDDELNKRLELLTKSDIIAEGTSSFQFRGIPDDLFNQVVQKRFAYEIENLNNEETAADINRQNRETLAAIPREAFLQNKGLFLEFMKNRSAHTD